MPGLVQGKWVIILKRYEHVTKGRKCRCIVDLYTAAVPVHGKWVIILKRYERTTKSEALL